jgi:hypothetical protein
MEFFHRLLARGHTRENLWPLFSTAEKSAAAFLARIVKKSMLHSGNRSGLTPTTKSFSPTVSPRGSFFKGNPETVAKTRLEHSGQDTPRRNGKSRWGQGGD